MRLFVHLPKCLIAAILLWSLPAWSAEATKQLAATPTSQIEQQQLRFETYQALQQKELQVLKLELSQASQMTQTQFEAYKELQKKELEVVRSDLAAINKFTCDGLMLCWSYSLT